MMTTIFDSSLPGGKHFSKNHLFADWPEDSFRRKPYTIDDVVDILREKGYETEILVPAEEQTVCFKMDGVPFYVETLHIPSLIFALDLPIRRGGLTFDKVVQAAYAATTESFLAKIMVFPIEDKNYDCATFNAECIIDTKRNLRDNVDRYIDILMSTARRFFEYVQKQSDAQYV